MVTAVSPWLQYIHIVTAVDPWLQHVHISYSCGPMVTVYSHSYSCVPMVTHSYSCGSMLTSVHVFSLLQLYSYAIYLDLCFRGCSCVHMVAAVVPWLPYFHMVTECPNFYTQYWHTF